ncbi:MAG: single-stranded-DNA-specific exonuclease RecJ [Desulfobacteraceae bacterium]|nr:MAG: single-stranded-DNA-specific exonuclease RecJ [Desulfobacteraceae bacterium]
MLPQFRILSPDPGRIQAIADRLSCHRIIAVALVNRGVDSAEEADLFLHPSLNHLRAPFEIKDMERGARRIAEAVLKGEKILAFGDYDVDGVTSTVLLYTFLQAAGANVDYYIPHRRKEGYGLSRSYILDQAKTSGVRLIVTADCGSTGHDAVDSARREGIDVVITDHHNIEDPLPEAVAVINPKRKDCGAGFDHLSGVGVVFCLLICLRRQLRELEFWRGRPEPNLKRFLDLVALGTIADQVPLVKENRILTRVGFEQINSGRRPGLAALISACRLKAVKSAEDISYRLAPRLNAPGRLAHADAAVRLLIAEHADSAAQIAAMLDRLNSERQQIEAGIFDSIEDRFRENPHLLEKASIVLADPGWHEGVLGIVAARLAEKYCRPVVLISTAEETGKGSARSIDGFDLFNGIWQCRDTLLSFGGHAAAAGVRIDSGKIQPFEAAFERAVLQNGGPDAHCAFLDIDSVIAFKEITADLLDSLELLQPFGPGNPEPLFMAKNLEVVSQRIVGSTHRQMVLKQNGAPPIAAVQFNVEPCSRCDGLLDSVHFHLRWNHWNGNRTPQLILRSILPLPPQRT